MVGGKASGKKQQSSYLCFHPSFKNKCKETRNWWQGCLKCQEEHQITIERMIVNFNSQKKQWYPKLVPSLYGFRSHETVYQKQGLYNVSMSTFDHHVTEFSAISAESLFTR
jgi:hypothetical protein